MTGVRVTVSLTRRQAAALLDATLTRYGAGVRRSADLVEAERRMKDAVRSALDSAGPPPMQTEPGA